VTVGILALAAGRARRFGSDKRLARLPDGRTCIEAFLDQLADSGFPVLVCLGPEDQGIADLLDERGCFYCHCPRAVEGMGGTLANGVTHVPGWDGLMVALADMPWIASDTYCAVASALEPGTIAVPVFDGERGHPVGFDQKFFAEIAALSGDDGARGLLEKHRDSIREVTVADPAIRRDVDTPEDLTANSALH
jgi:molybdenum cofactor cytidylyltransferase